MSIDKSWMQLKLSDPKYFNGVASFMEFAISHALDSDGKVRCPCRDDKNTDRFVPTTVQRHLLYRGFMEDYIVWDKHGEKEDSDSSVAGDSENYNDGDISAGFDQCDDVQDLIEECIQQDPNRDAQKFYKLLDESEVPLYPGCEKYSNLSFTINLMHIKSTGNMSNKAFDQLLKLLKEAFPMCDKLPTSNYRAKKIVEELGLHYERIDACKNDCVIYYGDLVDAKSCPTCKLSRWKTPSTTTKKKGEKSKKIPWKVLRYFPITSRLQRLFMSSKTAPDMRWHFEDRVKDGVLRHPSDAEAWKSFD
ncbi:uncharacterized protein LOC126784123 [Argentina anserina]|uniref:uncharacterized protein LOC126784123 n=1 Tax=Argentina anserina TaxID=57926 RepID=UPI00217669E9|nr:uncharacterized protein LOC126784123 [Potentilla anserina]